MDNLIDSLIKGRWLRTPEIIEAFRVIKRLDFLPEDKKEWHELNEAMPIGFGQTISQPLVVAFMLELLQPKPGERILDIGAGSGWTTALLAYIVSQQGNSKSEILNPKQIQNSNVQNSKGKVIGIEIIPELAEFGKKNVAKYNFIEKGIVEFICGDGTKGFPEQAPYDKILCSASIRGRVVPLEWKEQLKSRGIIVAPVGSAIRFLRKVSEIKFETVEYPGFVFVPLVSS